MIVVVGSPILLPAEGDAPVRPGGLAAEIALAAAARAARVQVVAKVGDDPAGDAILIALAAGGVGHAAVLRDAAHQTPIADRAMPLSADVSADDALEIALDDEMPTDAPLPAGLPLEAADVGLALRYLTEFRVLVLAVPLEPAVLREALDAAQFAGAHVIRLDGAAESVDNREETVFEPPADPDAAFAGLVGRYAATLDSGADPRDAFAAAVRDTNWERAGAG
jgi:hypothetical protein